MNFFVHFSINQASPKDLKNPCMVPDFQFLVSLGRISFTWYNRIILEFCFAHWCVNEIFCTLQFNQATPKDLKNPCMVKNFQFLVSLGRISFTWYNKIMLEFCSAHWCVNEFFCALQYQLGIIQGSQKALHGTRFPISSFTWWNSYRLVK